MGPISSSLYAQPPQQAAPQRQPPQPVAPMRSPIYQNQNGYAQAAALAPPFPTNNYEFCYGQLGEPGSNVKFGPYVYINFEPLPAGVIDNIEFDATFPGNITWQIWRLNTGTSEFEVVESFDMVFESGKQSISLMQEIEDDDLLGFQYNGTDQIPIKFSKFVGAQSLEIYLPSPIWSSQVSINSIDLIDQLFNYRVCMYSVKNSKPLQSTSEAGGFGNNYITQTTPYYSSASLSTGPGFGPAPYPVPGYDYSNVYYPEATYGISQYKPVQPYYYDYYNPNPQNQFNQYSPSYTQSTAYGNANAQQFPLGINYQQGPQPAYQGNYQPDGYYNNNY